MKIYQVLVYYFTTPFSGVLREAYLEYGRTPKGLKFELTLVPSLQIKQRKNSPRKYVWQSF